MQLIALEEHVLPADLAKLVWTDEFPRSIVGAPGLHAKLADIEEKRLPAMDAAGIEIQVLSSVAPAFQAVEAERATTLTRALNDEIAGIVKKHPTRFRAFASLPTPDPIAAAAEAKRAIEELGMVGVMIQGHTDGRFLDAPEFTPMLAAIEALGVPLYLHPTFPHKQVAEIYYGGLPDEIAGPLSTAAWGWHAETGLHIIRMAAGGVFERHPKLQVIVGHMGENLPFSLMRASGVLSAAREGLPSIADVVREHVHITICGYATLPPFRCALDVFGADRILFSVDYPFGEPKTHSDFLAEAPISAEDRDKIGFGNAKKLLRL